MSPEEAEAWERRLAEAPELRAECEEWRALRGVMQTSVREDAEAVLRPFFTDRLMRRLRPGERARPESFVSSLAAVFRPVVIAGLLLIAILVGYNVASYEYEASASATEAVLGLPPVTVATAFDVAYDPEFATLSETP